MQQPELPPKPEETTSDLVAKIVAANFVVLLVLRAIWGIGVLALLVLNLLIGVGLLFTRHRKLGMIMVLSGLTVALLGLGTCALILNNLHVNH